VVPPSRDALLRSVLSCFSEVKFDDDDDDVVRAGIPSTLVSTGWGRKNSSWLNATTYHTTDTFRTKKEEILANATLLNEVFDIYQADFKMFKFSMPKSVHEHCANYANFRDRMCAYLSR